jgi:enoyl-CoA hydratase
MSELFIARHARVLQLTLNRPQARNALNNALLTQIADVLDAAALDPMVGVCVISGNERFFAAGADLNEMAEKICPPRSMIFARGCGRVSTPSANR